MPPMSAINTLGVFARHQLAGKPMPALDWKHEDTAGHPRLTVKSSVPPQAARLWVAQAPTQDFRQAKWVERPLEVNDSSVAAEIELPATGSSAFYASLEFVFEEVPYSLCTQLRIVDAAAAGGAR